MTATLPFTRRWSGDPRDGWGIEVGPPTVRPEDVFERPMVARVYDCLLGGAHNFAADRAAAEGLLAVMPDAGQVARAFRGFLGRAVRYLAAEAGITQFLDIGSGLTMIGSVHDIARQTRREARVVYVDVDLVAVCHNEIVLAGIPDVAAIEADLRNPQGVLEHPRVRALLDSSEPVAVVLGAVLPFVGDEDRPGELVACLRDAVASGSYLVISHPTGDGHPSRAVDAAALFGRTVAPVGPRSHREIAGFFDGFDLVDPGLVDLRRWRPDWPDHSRDDSVTAAFVPGYGGIGRKP
jgi:S-adenosyl methyltransferase